MGNQSKATVGTLNYNRRTNLIRKNIQLKNCTPTDESIWEKEEFQTNDQRRRFPETLKESQWW
jgi:hypothetical protein